MINVKEQVFDAIKDLCENVSDSYPSNWANLPAIQYVEEDNKVFEWCDGAESKSYLRYKIDIWHNRSTSEATLEADKAVSALGLKRTMCQDVADSSGLKHKVLRYEGVIDVETQMVFQYNN